MIAAKQDQGESTMWSAKVGNTRPDDEGTKMAGSSPVAPAASAGPTQAVLLVPVQMTAGAGECVQHLVGAWLQSILRKYATPPACILHGTVAAPSVVYQCCVSEGCSVCHAEVHV